VTAPEPTSFRRYELLLRAINEVLAVLTADGDEQRALESSFQAAAEGFGAANALLLRVEPGAPPRLRCILNHGRLTEEQIQACERGVSVKGVSPSVIRRVIETGKPELVEDPRMQGAIATTASLSGGEFSVLCAPICDAAQQAVLAVIYFQNGGLRSAYRASDLTWLEGYASALARVFAYRFHVTLANG
jgi:GAF domain